MDYLKNLILLLLSILPGSIGKDATFEKNLLSKAQFLCPYTSFCDAPPLIQTQYPEGKVSCCKICSCEPGCEKSNTCCFPNLEALDVKRECLYPAVSQRLAELVRGDIGIFKTVIDVKNCESSFIVINQTKADSFTSKTKNSSNDTCICDGDKNANCDTCTLNDTKCGECYCNMLKQQENGIEILVVEKCVCDKPIGKETNCPCGDIKVAPWGSMLPVYSRRKQLLYKNPVCAACDGVSDGIVWIPLIQCLDFMSTFRGMSFGPENSQDCMMNFVIPNIIDVSFLPHCAKKDVFFKNVRFPIPNGLNMSAEQIINACESNFNSIYDYKKENVFCAVSHGVYTGPNDICYGMSDIRAYPDKITFLMTLDFLMMKTTNPANPVPKQVEIACSPKIPSDCREVLCPIGQIRNDRGICSYPMAHTYIHGYSVCLRLMAEDDVLDLLPVSAKKTVRFENFTSPWSSNWIISLIILENTRLLSSGILKNKTAFIVRMDLNHPGKKQTHILGKVNNALKKKWIVKVDMISVKLRSEILEYTRVIFDHRKQRLIPGSLLHSKEFDNLPDWMSIYVHDASFLNRNRNFIEVTHMLFCQQINLDPVLDAYEFKDNRKLIYLKAQNRYIFEANFIFNLNGQQKVRVCIDDTEFVTRTASVSTKLAINTIVVMCTFVLHCVAYSLLQFK